MPVTAENDQDKPENVVSIWHVFTRRMKGNTIFYGDNSGSHTIKKM